MLSLVLVAGLGMSEAFADSAFSEVNELNPVASPQDETLPTEGNVVFQNGVEFVPNTIADMDTFIIANDFELDQDEVISDVHFVVELSPPPETIEPLHYFFYDNNGVIPGTEIASGDAQNVELMAIPGTPNHFMVWFDLEDGVPLSGSTTFWLGLNYGDPFISEAPFPSWSYADNDFGVNARALNPSSPNWESQCVGCGQWFQLTTQQLVGGEFLPIDSTALILAGSQTNAVWIISALAVIGSVAFGALYITSKKN